MNKIISREKAIELRHQLADKKIIFTNGCFDILHAGHVSYLEAAKTLGDLLIIGLNSDASVRQLKGPTRPINSQEDRAIVLSALWMVDYVIIFEEQTPINLIQLLKPDIHVKGGDYTAESLPEYPVIKAYGGEIRILPFLEGKSTTQILQKI